MSRKPFLWVVLTVSSLVWYAPVCVLADVDSSTNATTDEPRKHYFLLLDTSSSMKGPRFVRQKRIHRLKESLVQSFLPYLSSDTVLTIVTFDKGIQEERTYRLWMPNETESVVRDVNALSAEGTATYAWSSLRYVLGLASERYSSGTDVGVFMYTDGEDNEEDGPTFKQACADYEVLRRFTREKCGLQIFTLGFALRKEIRDRFEKAGAIVEDVPDKTGIPCPRIVSFRWWPLRGVVGKNVKFLNESIPVSSRKDSSWSFGDKSGEVKEVEPVHIFEKKGVYSVSLLVGKRRSTGSITVIPPSEVLVADFVWAPKDVVAGDKIRFVARSEGSVQAYRWQVGRRAFTERDMEFTFEKAGDYRVGFRVRGKYGIAETNRVIKVRPIPPPACAFDVISRGPHYVAKEIYLRSRAKGRISSYRWQIGKNDIRTKEDPGPLVFKKLGDVRVVLTVEGPGGTSRAEKLLSIRALPVRATFKFNPTMPEAGERVQFMGDSAGPVEKWQWKIGEEILTNQHVTYRFEKSGNYAVELTVKSADGASHSAKTNVQVTNPSAPSAAFDIQTSEEDWKTGENITCLNTTTGTDSEWSWDFGDKGSSKKEHGSHRYVKEGTYKIVLTAIGPGGRSKAEKEIRIEQSFDARFAAVPRKGLLALFYRDQKEGFLGMFGQPCEVKIENLASGTNLKCKWDFGDGSSSTDESPEVHHYDKIGSYRLALDVTEQKTDFTLSAPTVTITVKPSPWPMILTRAAAVGAAAGILLVLWWYKNRPPPVKRAYKLDSLLKEGEEELWIGGGWRGHGRGHSGRFHIPLPPRGSFVGDYMTLKKSPVLDDVEMNIDEGMLQVRLEGATLSRFVSGRPQSLEGKPDEVRVSAGEVFLIDDEPYIGIISGDGSPVLAPGWKAIKTGAERLSCSRGGATIPAEEWLSDAMPLVNDDELLCEAVYKFRVEFDKQGGASLICDVLPPNQVEGDVEL